MKSGFGFQQLDSHEHQTDEIMRELDRQGLKYYSRGAGGNTYNIVAKRIH